MWVACTTLPASPPPSSPPPPLLSPPPADTYNPFLGFSGECQECPGLGLDTYTSYAAAQQCDVDRLDLACDSDDCECCRWGRCPSGSACTSSCALPVPVHVAATALAWCLAHSPLGHPSPGDADKEEGSFAYDQASQQCQKCAAGTWRNYEASTECEPCPEGTYSAEGDATCTACPAGEYNPLQGLADQFEITGFHCVVCAEGSVALNTAKIADALASVGELGENPLEIGATVCDAWCVGCVRGGGHALLHTGLPPACCCTVGLTLSLPLLRRLTQPPAPHSCPQPCRHLPARLPDGLRGLH